MFRPAFGILTIKGNFTLWKYLKDLHDFSTIERTIGFHQGRLTHGYRLVVLAAGERIDPDDIDLGGSTRTSGGTNILPTSPGSSIELLLTERGQDVQELKRKVCTFFAAASDNRPAKILPNLRHNEHMEYPDAEALAPGVRSGVPQFNLSNPKKFSVVREVGYQHRG
ncbi:hypothetical protein CI1B_63570 [Bradyrhizobium ivorense]|uniref:Uncharacterized protein n=1 Tax=Bradyrhizobium ivorense TaxID=2511166 RepID=A0A508TQ19_9BRAD|nr:MULTISPECIES: hypothetical protein [Bradyrhizobium]MCC8941073.1 hypothetical protein [Bradyrhizobium ivorense]QOZ27462.1 hypothetical protein XH93_30495 [Bradyrhizobium sp. CCBAU 51753]VIO76334.1 hypothetical protein CI1B_63570 [Bradyrhizobium ivorense]VIO78117.1 hypothetical protein CI41S_61290 [Bradyrhizobium ivorense]